MPTKMPELNESDFEFSRKLFAGLAKHQYTSAAGANRLGYSQECFWALDYVGKLGWRSALTRPFFYKDLAGTRYAVLEPEDKRDKRRPALLMGSHVDAVAPPNGGQYDGMAGVAAAWQAMEIIVRRGIEIRQPVVVVMFPNEESSRFQFAVSSKAAAGRLVPEALDMKDKLGPQTLGEAMEEFGAETGLLQRVLKKGEPLLPREEVAAFAEAHIEQADSLADEGCGIGLVNAVCGSARCGYVRFDGVAAHSGACPQRDRRDAIPGAAEFILKLEDFCKNLASRGHLVWSFGDTRVNGGGAQNIVSPNTEILFDFRSPNETLLWESVRAVQEIGKDVAKKRGLVFSFDMNNVIVQKPVVMDKALLSGFASAARAFGLWHERMPSGAGHDAQVLQENGWPSAILFIPHRGGSHRADERMTVNPGDDPFAPGGGYANAVRLLTDYAAGNVVEPKEPNQRTFANALLNHGAVPVDMMP